MTCERQIPNAIRVIKKLNANAIAVDNGTVFFCSGGIKRIEMKGVTIIINKFLMLFNNSLNFEVALFLCAFFCGLLHFISTIFSYSMIS